jgi:hypothetical protein
VQDPNNLAPVATAHRFLPVGEITRGDEVVLDATGSEDPENKPLTYAWLQVAGPSVILENPSSIRPTFTPVLAATYTFQLTVSDAVNQSFPALVSLTVKDQPGDVTYAASLSYGAGVLPNGHAALGTFNLQASTTAPNTNNNYYFYLEQTGGPGAIINSSFGDGQLLCCNSGMDGIPYAITPSTPGYYTFRLSATRTDYPSFSLQSLIRVYATIGVTVDGAAPPPPQYLVPTADAGTPQTAVAGQTVTLSALGSTGATRYYWTQVEGPPVALSNANAVSPSLTPVGPGQYTFALTVADATSSSAPSFVVVTVDPAPAATTSSGGGNGGCGFLGLEGFLLLPLIWLLSALRSRIPAGRNR